MPIKQEMILECDLCEGTIKSAGKPSSWAIITLAPQDEPKVICPECVNLILEARGLEVD